MFYCNNEEKEIRIQDMEFDYEIDAFRCKFCGNIIEYIHN